MLLNGLAIVLFLGFSTGALIVFSTLDKQKEITIRSRYGRHTGTWEIIYVNVALLLVAYTLVSHRYRFLPVLVAFVVWIVLLSRIQSGISPQGVFIGTTFLEWEQMKAYQITNDEISTIQLLIFVNRKQYVMRCSKEDRKQIEAFFTEHQIMNRKEFKS